MFTYLNKQRSKKGFTLVELIVVVCVVAIMTAVSVPNFINSQRSAEGSKSNEHARSFYHAVQNTLVNAMEDDNTEAEFMLSLGIDDSGANNADFFRLRTSPFRGRQPISSFNSTLGTQPPTGAPTVSNGRFFFIYVSIAPDGVITADLAFCTAQDYIGAATPPNIIASYNSNPHSGTNPNGREDLSATTRPWANNVHNKRTFQAMIDEIFGYFHSGGERGNYWAMFDPDFRVAVAYYSKFVDRAGVHGQQYENASGRRNEFRDARMFGAYPVQYALTGTIGTHANTLTVPWNRGPTPRWFVNTNIDL